MTVPTLQMKIKTLVISREKQLPPNFLRCFLRDSRKSNNYNLSTITLGSCIERIITIRTHGIIKYLILLRLLF